MDDYPNTLNDLIRYFFIVRTCWTKLDYPGDMGNSKDALYRYVFEWIATTKEYLEIMRTVDEDLFNILYADGMGFYAGDYRG